MKIRIGCVIVASLVAGLTGCSQKPKVAPALPTATFVETRDQVVDIAQKALTSPAKATKATRLLIGDVEGRECSGGPQFQRLELAGSFQVANFEVDQLLAVVRKQWSRAGWKLMTPEPDGTRDQVRLSTSTDTGVQVAATSTIERDKLDPRNVVLQMSLSTGCMKLSPASRDLLIDPDDEE